MPNSDINIHDVSGQIAFAQVGGNFTGDIIAGNKTIINHIIQQAAKQIVTAPYKFLASYDISDRDIFFGRDAVIEKLVGKLPRYKTLVINGRSGSGKTSLINAGLIPRLADNGYQFLSFREYTDPLRQLREHVAQDDLFKPYVDQATSLMQFLKTVTRQHKQQVVVIFDQFERFFVNVLPAVRTQFIQEIKVCLDSDLSGAELDLVFALREEFFGQLTREFGALIPTFIKETDLFNLEPLNRAEARDAILKPLERIPLKIGYDLDFVDTVLLPGLMGESTGGMAIDPPHLQIVCNQLYEKTKERYAAKLERGGVAEIDRALYDDLHGTTGILHSYLDDRLAKIAPQLTDGQAVLRSMLKTMVETTGTRKFVALREVQHELADVSPDVVADGLRLLREARVIETRGQDDAASYSLSHEVMVAKVHSWFDARELERKKAQETLERGLAEWKSTEAVLNERQVEHIRKWVSSENLSAEAEQLLTHSQQVYEERQRKEVEQERRIRLGKRILWSVITVAFVVASVLTFWALRNARESKIQALDALNTSAYNLFLAKQDELGSLLAAVKVGQQIKQANVPPDLQWRAAFNLHDIIDGIHERNRLVGHTQSVWDICFSRDGRFLASASWDRTITLWDVSDGQVIRTFTGHIGRVWNISFSPDGRLLASSADDGIKLWDVADGREIMSLTDSPTASVSFSPDGQMLAAGSSTNGRISLWDVNDGGVLRSFRGHSGWVSSLSFHPDGNQLVSGGLDHTIKLWNVSDGQELRTFPEQSKQVVDVSFSPDGRLIASCGEGGITLWNAVDGTVINTFKQTSVVWSVSFSSDSKWLVSGGSDQVLTLWDVNAGVAIKTFSRHLDWVRCLSFSPDGRFIVSGSSDNTIKIWEASSGRELRTLTQPLMFISALNLSPDGRLAALLADSDAITLWDTATGRELRTVPIQWSLEMGIFFMSFSPDGQLFASGDYEDFAIRLWNVAEGQELKTFTGHTDTVLSLSFSPDNQILASGSDDQTIKLWNVSDGEEIKTLTGHKKAVIALGFNPDGQILASGSRDGVIKLWKISNGQEVATFTGHTDAVSSLNFSPDGQFLVSGSVDRTIKLWDVRSSQTIQTFSGHTEGVLSVRFSPDGRRLVSGSNDQTVKLWDVASGQELGTFKGHTDIVLGVSFNADGTEIVSGSWGQMTLKRWWIGDLNESLRRGCAWLQGYLHNNPTVSAADRALCDDVLKTVQD